MKRPTARPPTEIVMAEVTRAFVLDGWNLVHDGGNYLAFEFPSRKLMASKRNKNATIDARATAVMRPDGRAQLKLQNFFTTPAAAYRSFRKITRNLSKQGIAYK